MKWAIDQLEQQFVVKALLTPKLENAATRGELLWAFLSVIYLFG